jgi:cellulose synthase/poly-beta-1,6-N-acetylglucosamine synthase-like glycosyltransferase
MEFCLLDIHEANQQRRKFVRHANTNSRASLTRAYGRNASPGCPPRVSIVVPTADGVRYGYLPALLEQLKQQSLQDFEVLVAQGDSRQGRAINVAAAVAQGTFLLTFDDDTRLGTPHLIERLVAAVEADPHIGMAGCANLVPPDASWLVRHIMLEVPRRSSPLVSAITDSDMAEHPCLVMRRELFYQVGGEHEIVPRGLDPYLRREFRAAGYRVVVVPDVWIHHLPPPTPGKVLRQFFRNGSMSALVSRQFPDLALDNALRHGEASIRSRPGWFRTVRHGCRMAAALITFRWVYLTTSLAYGLGVVSDSLTRGRR